MQRGGFVVSQQGYYQQPNELQMNAVFFPLVTYVNVR